MRRYLLVPLMVIVLVLMTACGRSPVAPMPENTADTLTLASINGKPLPQLLLRVGFNHIMMTEGAVIMDMKNGTFVDSLMTETWVIGARDTTVFSKRANVARGTYIKTGGLVTFSPTQGAQYTMRDDGRTLTQTIQLLPGDSTTTFIYRRK